MKYSHEIIIDLPREKVIELFDDPDNAYEWMEGLQNYEQLSGNPGEKGAKSRWHYETKRGKMVIDEEITKKDFPDVINFVFTSKGVTNWNDNRFESLDENQTKWVQSNVFKCKGMVWVFAKIMPGAFKKQSFKYMTDFKSFAEKKANEEVPA